MTTRDTPSRPPHLALPLRCFSPCPDVATDRHVRGQPACGHFRGQGSGWSGAGTGPAAHLGWIKRLLVRPTAMVTRPGAVRSCRVILPARVPASVACSYLFLAEPAGSCLTFAELVQSSACFLPYWAREAVLETAPHGPSPVWGLDPGHGGLRLAPSAQCPCWPAVSLWLLGSGSTRRVSGARFLAPRLSREADRVSSSLQSLCVWSPLQPSLPPTPGAGRALLGSHPEPRRPTQHTHSSFLPTFPFRV